MTHLEGVDRKSPNKQEPELNGEKGESWLELPTMATNKWPQKYF